LEKINYRSRMAAQAGEAEKYGLFFDGAKRPGFQ
jgi:hypothetical protein